MIVKELQSGDAVRIGDSIVVRVTVIDGMQVWLEVQAPPYLTVQKREDWVLKLEVLRDEY